MVVCDLHPALVPAARVLRTGPGFAHRRRVQADAKDAAESLMRSVTQTECYSALEKVPPRGNLLVSVDANSECILLPIMGVLVPFHITTVKGVSYSQDGEAQEKVHSYVRIQFNTMPSYEARAAHPAAVLIKELSFRSAKPEAAHKFVQARLSPALAHTARMLMTLLYPPHPSSRKGATRTAVQYEPWSVQPTQLSAGQLSRRFGGKCAPPGCLGPSLRA